MDKNQQGLGMFNSYGKGDPGMNSPVSYSPNTINPYMNFDPALIQANQDSQFIFPEGASHQRGRFELAFSQIGGSVLTGMVVPFIKVTIL